MKSLKRLLFCMILFVAVFQPIVVQGKSEINIVFIIDRSGSMGDDINDVRNQVGTFTNLLEDEGIPYKLGLVTYERDTNVYSMTKKVITFKDYLRRIDVSGGTENGLDAIEDAIDDYTYTYNALKYFVLIGDEKIYSDRGNSDSDIIQLLKREHVILTAVGESRNRSQFKDIATHTGGQYLDLASGFGTNLAKIFDQIQQIPVVDIVSPSENQMFSDFDNAFIPYVNASDPDSDNLTFSFFVDNETTPRETKTITNTQTSQTVGFSAFDMGSLSEGEHTLKFVVHDGSDSAQDMVNIKVDLSPPVISDLVTNSSETGIDITGESDDYISGLENNPYRYGINGSLTEWKDSCSHSFNSLLPNTLYHVEFAVRDKVGHINQSNTSIYTKAQIPIIDEIIPGTDTMTIHISDNNPFTTEYQVVCGTKYLSNSGFLVSEPEWVTSDSKSFTTQGLEQNKAYAFKIRARNEEGVETLFSQPKSSTTLLEPPSSLDICPSQTVNILTWENVMGADGYDIELNGDTIINIGYSTTYSHTGLVPERKYNYRIRVRNAGGTGPWSKTFSMRTLPYPPDVPSGIEGTSTKTTIRLTWNDSAGAEGYEVRNGASIFQTNNNLFIHEELQPNTGYQYAVRAFNHGGFSDWSETFSITTLPDPPAIPKNLQVEAGIYSVSVTWDPVEEAERYIVETTGIDKQIYDNGSNTTFIHENLVPASGYQYRVRAANAGGVSEWSSPAEIETLPEKPEMPSNIMASAVENTITLTWYKVPYAESYDVEINGSEVIHTDETSFVHEGLDYDVLYSYRVRAKNISGNSLWSESIPMYTLPEEVTQGGGGNEPGDAPTSLDNIVAVVTNHSVMISWSAAAIDADYCVEVDGEKKDNGKNTVFHHTGLSPNSFHVYKLWTSSGKYEDTCLAVFTLSTLPDPPNAPTITEIFADYDSIELVWEKSEGAAGYDIEIDGEVFCDISFNTYLHDSLEPGTSHTYRVRAKNITGETAWSSAVMQSTSNPETILDNRKDALFHFSLVASNIQDFTEMKFRIEYDTEELEVIDICSFTPEYEVESGQISGTRIRAVVNQGSIEYVMEENIVPGKVWSGEIVDIIFRAKISGEKTIHFILQ